MRLLTLKTSEKRAWFAERDGEWTVQSTGWAFVASEYLEGGALARHILRQLQNLLAFSNILRNLNGNFAIVAQSPNCVCCGVDAVRSIPLLYRIENNTLHVSDDARLITKTAEARDQVSLIELATAGYVTGPHTIYRKVRGLQSGECLLWQAERLAPELMRYYTYFCTYDYAASRDELAEQLDTAVQQSFTRIVESVQGRQVIVPLSGGLDSRLVAASLKRLGYDNVLCMSYGVPGSKEEIISRSVADKLGYRWIKLPYCGAMLRKLMKAEEVGRYQAFGFNGISMPHHDDWPAIRALQNQKMAEENAVFIPGHTGDFICGSHLKYILEPVCCTAVETFIEAMVGRHYSLWFDLVKRPHVRAAIEQRLGEILGGRSLQRSEDYAGLYEMWEWQERQSKYIINAVRGYEFFNYSWRIPLWDRALMDFWQGVPITLKRHKSFYRFYLSSFDPCGVFNGIFEPVKHCSQRPVASPVASIRKSLREYMQSQTALGRPLQKYFSMRRHFDAYNRGPIGFERAYSPMRYIFVDSSKRQVVSLMVKDFLQNHLDVSMTSLKFDSDPVY